MAEWVGIVASLVGQDLVKCIVEPIKRQFNYLCCLRSNIDELRDEAKKLEDAGDSLQTRVTTDENNAQVILLEVKSWLGKANDQLQVNINGIESEITNIKTGCLAVKSRYVLSRKVKKTTEAVKELREDCNNFGVISQPPQPACVVPPPLGQTYEFESRKKIEEGIMRALRGEKAKTLGICGMGGVGKTTMAIKIMKRVREEKEKLFDETVMVAVSQKVDKFRIQDELAEKLGLELKGTIVGSRAHKLRTRLTGGKKILVVVDDVWESLKLEELGIPCEETETGSKCTTLLTSRDKDVLINMKAQPICEIQTLSETEAWSLFTEKIGADCMDDQDLLSIGQDVAKQCKGLPIALVNVAMVLEGKKDKFIWEDALAQLKSANPQDLPRILAEVYNPIKLSYDFLESPRAKSIFLMCCLFPEDFNIPIENLFFYAVGLRIFGTFRNLKEARNRTCSLVEMLKSRFLLLEGECHIKDHVKMHDVVRDVAIYIASNEKRIESSERTWLSSLIGDQRINELSMGSTFPNLRLLLIDDAADKELEINDSSFEKMKGLNVLSLKHGSLRSLPQTTQLLENLRTLILSACESLNTISVVGKLVNLEILICRSCVSVKELPIEIGCLSRLKLLELSDCLKLRKIAPGVMSNLAGLEELKMADSFTGWEAEVEGKERNNAALSELQSLCSLTNLEIEVQDCTLAAEEIRLPPKIVKFHIMIGDYEPHIPRGFEKTMVLNVPREITLANWIHECVRSVESMCLRGDGSSNLDLGQAQNVRWLDLESCSTVKKLVNITMSSIGTATIFPHLEDLCLEELANLEEIYTIDGSIIPEGSFNNNAFRNLKALRLLSLPALKLFWKDLYQINGVVSRFSNLSEVIVCGCDSLRNLFSFSPSIANDCLLQQLKSLQIWNCEMMEQVFLWDDENLNKNDIGQESRHIKIIFPKLEFLLLHYLPNLTTFCKGIESIEFPMLSEMIISVCPKLESLASSSAENDNQSSSGGNSHDDDNHSLHLFCKPEKVAFGGLKKFENSYDDSFRLWCDKIPSDFFSGLEKLSICYCDNIRSLFSFSIARNLVNLKCLEIRGCEKMIKVIEDEEEEEKLDACGGQSRMCLFPNLKKLYLMSSPELESFGEWRSSSSCALELPSLEEMIIRDCPKTERLCECALELPSLKEVEIFGCPKIERLSLGSVVTPNLDVKDIDIYAEDVDSDDLNQEEKKDWIRDFNDTKDLNAYLQQVFSIYKKAKEKKEAETETEEEEN